VTVGVDFSSKIVLIDEEPVQLQIWDTVIDCSFSVGRIYIRPSPTISIAELPPSFWFMP
jgi:hypothetical protein